MVARIVIFAFFEILYARTDLVRNVDVQNDRNPICTDVVCVLGKEYSPFFASRLFVVFHNVARIKTVTQHHKIYIRKLHPDGKGP